MTSQGKSTGSQTAVTQYESKSAVAQLCPSNVSQRQLNKMNGKTAHVLRHFFSVEMEQPQLCF
jgi:hypothetical protein